MRLGPAMRLFVTVAVATVACTPPEPAEAPAPLPFEVRVFARGCSGACPEYVFTVNESGRAELDARKHPTVRGKAHATVDVNELRWVFRRNRFHGRMGCPTLAGAERVAMYAKDVSVGKQVECSVDPRNRNDFGTLVGEIHEFVARTAWVSEGPLAGTR